MHQKQRLLKERQVDFAYSLEDKARFRSYRDLARGETDVLFGGRLGAYRYLDMHQAIGAALSAWEKDLRPRLTSAKPFELQEAV